MRIIDLCRTVEHRGIDPFEVDVEGSLRMLKEYLPEWKLLDELLCDAEAIREISKIIRLQSDWIKDHARFAHDPLLVELKIKMMENEDLARVLSYSLHPIVSLDRISSKKLEEAMIYWNNISKGEEMIGNPSYERSYINLEDLHRLNILSDEEFSDLTKMLELELENRGRVEYWDFISAETFEETVKRAYILSFLMTNDLVRMEKDPLSDSVFLLPEKDPNEEEARSMAIQIEYEKWKKERD